MNDPKSPSEQTAVAGYVARWRWRARRSFWNWLTVFKYTHQEPTPIVEPPLREPNVRLVPLHDVYPEIPISRISVAAEIPGDERERLKRGFTRVQRFVGSLVPISQPGVPEVDADPNVALDQAFTSRHRTCYPTPRRTTADLGQLAVASPYASYLSATGDGGFVWDLSVLRDFEHHPGVDPLGAVVTFEFDPPSRTVRPVRIELPTGSSTPSSGDWERAQRRAMSSITTHASTVRHFNWLHLTAGAPLEAMTRNRLRGHHVVRRLLWAHIFGTHSSNDLVTEIQMSPGGSFETIFSLTQVGMCELFESTSGDFDLALINPVTDHARRGLADIDLANPAQENRVAIYDVIRAHTARYLDLYYRSDDDVANDQELGAWLNDLDRTIPHGLRALCGDKIGLDGLATLTATIIYLATVEHEITGTGLWDYQLWPDLSPVRTYPDGRRLPVDIYQHSVNANLNLNSRRLMLLDDRLPRLAADVRGEDAMRRFQQDLLALQSVMDRSPAAPWRLEPRHLKANINA